MVIVATLYDGRTIAKATQIIVVNAGDIGLTITIPELDNVEHVLELEVLTTSPPAEAGTFSHKVITANVVAVTLMNVSVGTTLTYECIAIGI